MTNLSKFAAKPIDYIYFNRLEAIPLLPCNPGGHAAYQDTFVSDFLKFYPDPFALPKSTWDYIVQFWYLDLSLTDSIMQECYSVFGPEPRLPSCMLRSYLLALRLKVTSITSGAACSGKLLFMPSSALSPSGILPVSGLFMISFPASAG